MAGTGTTGSTGSSSSSSSEIFDSLMDMDVVLFQRRLADQDDNQRTEEQKVELGAMQEDGTVAPLSAWSEDAAFGTSIEFLVDEEDRLPGLLKEDIAIIKVFGEDVISYGSRQVGGGKGERVSAFGVEYSDSVPCRGCWPFFLFLFLRIFLLLLFPPISHPSPARPLPDCLCLVLRFLGPGNPHGEESELLYYVEMDELEGIDFAINPDLEILW